MPKGSERDGPRELLFDVIQQTKKQNKKSKKQTLVQECSEARVFIQISHLNALSTHLNPVTGSQPEPSGPLSLKSNQNCSHLQRNGLLLTLKVCGLRAEEVHLCWIHVSLISAPFKANSREGGMDFKAMWCTVAPITQCFYSILCNICYSSVSGMFLNVQWINI